MQSAPLAVHCSNPMFTLQVLLSKGVEEGKILFLSLIAAPEGIHRICAAFPRVKVITSEIDEGIGAEFQVIPGIQAVQSIHQCLRHFAKNLCLTLIIPHNLLDWSETTNQTQALLSFCMSNRA